MDDDYKDNNRKGKPQQRLYKPGSGPLRRSGYGVDTKNLDLNFYGSQNLIDDMNTASKETFVTNSRHKKPEQQLYIPRSGDNSYEIDNKLRSGQHSSRKMSGKQEKSGQHSGSGSYSRGGSRRDYIHKDGNNSDVNYNRHYRQVSEPRSSPAQSVHEHSIPERNRDSQSMETSAGRHMSAMGSKPPSGRRNSAGYPNEISRPKYMNLDNIPPRFRKKFLEQSGHQSFDSVDQINRDKYYSNQSMQTNSNQNQFYNSNANLSQTLPSRGRGRLRENENFDREKFISSYFRNNYEVHNSRRSTPSNSYMNLCDPNIADSKNTLDTPYKPLNQTAYFDYTAKNGINTYNSTVQNNKENTKYDSDACDDISQSSTNLLDMTSLDWTEEVEKNIKLDDVCDSSTSFSQNVTCPSVSEDLKPSETRESKRSRRRRDKRSLSRGNKNAEKRQERNRKDSNVSVHQDQLNNHQANFKQIERERRDSHRSNRSSTLGNSRDDLDRWRSLRSYSREPSTEGRIVSQCNSRDTSVNRAVSPRDSDGFRVPSAAPKITSWSSANHKKGSGSWSSGRTPSVERGRHSPVPSTGGDGPEGITGSTNSAGGRRGRKSRSGRRRGRNAEGTAPPVHVPPGATPAPTNINWRDEIIESKKHMHDKHQDNNQQRNRLLPEKPITDSSTPHPGLLILPQSSMTHIQKDQGRAGSGETQKLLYDHHNPSKPIVVQTSPSKVDIRMERGRLDVGAPPGCAGEVGGGAGEAVRAARHRALLQEVDRADAVLHAHSMRGPLALAEHWADVAETRKCLQNALQRLLMSDLKYCQSDNVEPNFWKILYYNFIEILRRSLTQVSPEDKPKIVKLINTIIEEGNIFFESLVQMLEKTYKFNTEDYINDNHTVPPKGLGYVGLALVSVQKLYIFLGDLARYKEQVNDSHNFAKSKLWYTKAQQINPKNGRPYNQLAILAIYARRKLDAVYYYMRSLMSSNPFQSARESLLSLFDENRKKYEAAERKRRAISDSSRTDDKVEGGDRSFGTGGLRREVWIRPSGRRTTTLRQDTGDTQFANMTPVELNKNFITSYLHVHGKIITRVGMETFHESAVHMLRQFRALLNRQPLPTPAARLLQLTALNMFAVENAAASIKDKRNEGDRSGWLHCAVGVALLMFGALLERCCALLPEPAPTQQHADALLLLPAIKVWSDWMLCHSSIWNPPPSLDNFEIGSENDPWDWLAKLMNILEELDDKTVNLENEEKEGHAMVRLSEDASLAGFTPLMYMEPAAAWISAERPLPHHVAEHALRTRKLLFFGTEYLVGVEPPVLRLEYLPGAAPRYVSAVQRHEPDLPALQHLVLSEDSEEEDSVSGCSPSVSESASAEGADEDTRRLLRRKELLESRKATLEKRRQRMQEILRGNSVSVEVEVRPRWLVPDTNCFIDHLPLLQALVSAPNQPYTLAIPLVVVTELEGLQKCSRVGEHARAALAWMSEGGAGSAGVRFATTLGSVLATRAFSERDTEHTAPTPRANNDDRVLSTAIKLHENLHTTEPMVTDKGDNGREGREAGSGHSARGVREVVLLTEDRGLRVKALAAELPATDLPHFIHWAGLDDDSQSKATADSK